VSERALETSRETSRRTARRSALVVFPGALGDLVCLLPALRELGSRRFEQIFVACKSELAPLVEASQLATAIAIEDRRTAWLFQSEPPREAIEFYGEFERIDSFSGAGVPEVERNLARFRDARVHAFRPSDRKHLAVHFFEQLSGLRPTMKDLEIDLRPSPQAIVAARRIVSEIASPWLLIHPGSGGRAKRWSRVGFARMADRAARELGGVLVVCGDAEGGEEIEYWRNLGVRAASGMRVDVLAGLLSAADVYLGNDSGVSHLAGAVGTRGVALFGPTDPGLWRPLSPRLVSIRLDPWTPCDEAAPESALDRVWRALAPAGAP
jgi:heptosyltransferase III